MKETRSCQRCGKPYETSRWWAQYCSTKCKYEGWLIKTANKLIKEKKNHGK